MKLIISIIFLYFPVLVSAERFYMGKNLLDYCDNCVNSINVTASSACASCLSDIILIQKIHVKSGMMEPKACIESEINIRQLSLATKEYIWKNPDSLKKYSPDLIADSLERNYPCN